MEDPLVEEKAGTDALLPQEPSAGAPPTLPEEAEGVDLTPPEEAIKRCQLTLSDEHIS